MADAVEFPGAPKKAGDPDGAVAEPADVPAGKPTDRRALGAYRRKAG